jgi:hypothetical protein
MYSTCLFCDADFGENDGIEHLPVGRRLAFDPAKGRLWVVCRRCERWNLTPLEERWEAVEECERRFRGTTLRVSTENVGLARLRDGLELVRIGTPLRPELAAWRYGDQFGRRRRRAMLAAGATVATAAAVAVGGVTAGLAAGGAGGALLNAGGVLRAMYERRRVVCRLPAVGSDVAVVRGRHLREARILTGGPWGNRWGLFVSYGSGCVVFTGVEAVHVAGLLLARINGSGAPAADIQLAVDILERHGDAARCFQYAANRPEHERHRLAKLPVEIRLALEMAAHEETERQAIEGELSRVVRAWRSAEEIAAIADELLIPPSVLERIRRYRGTLGG